MLARCSRCHETFPTDRTGLQKCPHCGVDVLIPDRPVDAIAAPSSAPVSSETPWERREALGLWPALRQTIELAIGKPAKLFDEMDPARLDGVHSLFALLVIAPMLLGQIVGRVFSNPSEELAQATKLYDALGQDEVARQIRQLTDSLGWAMSGKMFVGELLLSPVFAFVSLYAIAGGTHLALRVLGHARGGFSGTLKASVYAQAPGFIMLVPGCGGLLFLLWATALQIFGLSRVHRTTVGMTTGAVLLFHGVVSLFCCGIPLIFLVIAISHGWSPFP